MPNTRCGRDRFAVMAAWCGRSSFPAGTRATWCTGKRELRRVAQAEHGEAAMARDEADGERAAARGAFS
jgi:hypothetical protein